MMKLFEIIDCPKCKGHGWVQGGDAMWECSNCKTNGTVYKHIIILKILGLIILILICIVFGYILLFLNSHY